MRRGIGLYILGAVVLVLCIDAGCGGGWQERTAVSSRSEIEVIEAVSETVTGEVRKEREANVERESDRSDIQAGTKEEADGGYVIGVSERTGDISDSVPVAEETSDGADGGTDDGAGLDPEVPTDGYSGADGEPVLELNGAEQDDAGAEPYTVEDVGANEGTGELAGAGDGVDESILRDDNTEQSGGNGEDSEVGVGEEPVIEETPIEESYSVAEETYEEQESLTYVGDWTITFYCDCEQCVGQYAGMNLTASGRTPIPWYTVAAGYSYPFGTELYIEGFGYFEVMDRGVGDGWADIFVSNHGEIPSYGMATASVYIVG